MDNEKIRPKAKKIAIVIVPIVFAIAVTVAVGAMMGGGFGRLPAEETGGVPAVSTPENDLAASADPDNANASLGLEFTVGTGGGLTVTGIGTCADSILKIPEKVDGKAVTAIGDSAFASVGSIKEVIIPNSVTSIGAFAFKGCSLEKVTIGNAVMHVGASAFSACPNLSEIVVDGANALFMSSDGVLFSRDMRELWCYPMGRTAPSYTIPKTVKDIKTGAFYACKHLKAISFEGNADEWNAVYVASGNNLLDMIDVEVSTSDK